MARFLLVFYVFWLMIKVVCGKTRTPEYKAIKVRLVGTNVSHVGQVEIQYNGTWGAVCGYWNIDWDINDAHVVCRMLDYKAAENRIIRIEGKKTKTLLMYRVGCNGTEKSIAECTHNGWQNVWSGCSYKSLAGVVCQVDKDPPPVQVRLAGGTSPNSGRVEVRYHGAWGTVCDDGWDKNGAEVVCRMLGYPGVQVVQHSNSNSTVKGIIWFNYLDCTTGTEMSIANCSHNEWGNTGCLHIEDVGVTCKIVTAPQFTVSSISVGLACTADLVINHASINAKEKKLIKSYEIQINKRGNSSSWIVVSDVVSNFKIGDGKYYNGHYNAPLEPGTMYNISVRAVTKAQNGGNGYGEATTKTVTTRSDCNNAKDFPKCPQQSESNIQWPSTAVGTTAVKRCPGNAIGQATRQCKEGSDSKPTWKDSNLSNCTSIEFTNYLIQAKAITSSDYTPSYNASVLLRLLENATKTNPTKKEGLYGRDIDITVEIFSILVNYSQANNSITSEKDQQNFLQIGSNILEPINKERWIQYEDQREKEKKTGLKFDFMEFESSLVLPPEVFSNDSNHQVVSLAYKTLNDVMRLKNGDTNTIQDQGDRDDSVLPSNTTIVTSVVRPVPTVKFKEKVKIVVKNKRIIERANPRICVFWKEGLPNTWRTEGCFLVASESNQYVTTCECDHMTVFAALMDPYGGPIPDVHRNALELISTIGSATSLFAVVMTILVTMFFWKTLKTPRTIVLMNICMAIAVVCVLIIAEGTARDTKIGCTLVAVLLHYFLLAVFCWMLCEGVLLYYKIVVIFSTNIEEKVKFFLLFGWGFPLLIVGISLAVTQTQGYGYNADQTVCWLAIDNGLIWAFIAPTIVVLLINIAVFILVIRQMMSTRQAKNKSRDEKLCMVVKATAVILPLLGITWVFGLLAFNSATLAFKYIFAILNSLQGLMIFIFHCLLNPQVQDAFKLMVSHFSCSHDTGLPESKSTLGKEKTKLQKYTESRL